ncbi:DUF6928 family protein [Kitasatospora sp. NPDC101447]|uniref:DUF6928 family protein n=1 Tax=Kitasatospora sp. NPDC101447 TaxID=3364102 RepID=UPI0037FF8BCD
MDTASSSPLRCWRKRIRSGRRSCPAASTPAGRSRGRPAASSATWRTRRTGPLTSTSSAIGTGIATTPRECRGNPTNASAGRRLVVHWMHSVVDFLAFAVWEDGQLVRSLSVSPGSGVMENMGEPLPFVRPSGLASIRWSWCVGGCAGAGGHGSVRGGPPGLPSPEEREAATRVVITRMGPLRIFTYGRDCTMTEVEGL